MKYPKKKIEFDSEWFESGYYVYVLKIVKKKNNFYYIGQTGDRKHVSARSPFYRLMGHFNPYNTPDSQLVKGLFNSNLLKKKNGESKRVCIEKAISCGKIKITAYFFKTDDFDNISHNVRRAKTETIETILIHHCRKNGKKLFNEVNHDTSKAIKDNNAEKIAKKIYKNIIL